MDDLLAVVEMIQAIVEHVSSPASRRLAGARLGCLNLAQPLDFSQLIQAPEPAAARVCVTRGFDGRLANRFIIMA